MRITTAQGNEHAPGATCFFGRRKTTQANNRWLAEQLHMGTPVAVSHHVDRLRRGHDQVAAALAKKLEKIKR